MELTMAEWKAKHRDFKGIVDGQRYALAFVPGSGTCSVPVTIVTEAERQLRYHATIHPHYRKPEDTVLCARCCEHYHNQAELIERRGMSDQGLVCRRCGAGDQTKGGTL